MGLFKTCLPMPTYAYLCLPTRCMDFIYYLINYNLNVIFSVNNKGRELSMTDFIIVGSSQSGWWVQVDGQPIYMNEKVHKTQRHAQKQIDALKLAEHLARFKFVV